MSLLTETQFGTLYGSSGTTFPDNTTGEISEGDLRQFGQDIKDSFQPRIVTAIKTRYQVFAIGEHSGVTGGSDIIVSSTDIVDGESVTIFFLYAGKDDDSNTGVGGQFTSSWTKASGTIQKVADTHTVNGNDIGGTLTVSTSDSSGSISLAVSLASATGNFSYSGIVHLIYRKAS